MSNVNLHKPTLNLSEFPRLLTHPVPPRHRPRGGAAEWNPGMVPGHGRRRGAPADRAGVPGCPVRGRARRHGADEATIAAAAAGAAATTAAAVAILAEETTRKGSRSAGIPPIGNPWELPRGPGRLRPQPGETTGATAGRAVLLPLAVAARPHRRFLRLSGPARLFFRATPCESPTLGVSEAVTRRRPPSRTAIAGRSLVDPRLTFA